MRPSGKLAPRDLGLGHEPADEPEADQERAQDPGGRRHLDSSRLSATRRASSRSSSTRTRRRSRSRPGSSRSPRKRTKAAASFAHAIEPLEPRQREEGRHGKQREEKQNEPGPPAERERGPPFRRPAQRIEHQAGGDLVGGFLFVGVRDLRDRERRQPVRDPVQQQAGERERRGEQERQSLPRARTGRPKRRNSFARGAPPRGPPVRRRRRTARARARNASTRSGSDCRRARYPRIARWRNSTRAASEGAAPRRRPARAPRRAGAAAGCAGRRPRRSVRAAPRRGGPSETRAGAAEPAQARSASTGAPIQTRARPSRNVPGRSNTSPTGRSVTRKPSGAPSSAASSRRAAPVRTVCSVGSGCVRPSGKIRIAPPVAQGRARRREEGRVLLRIVPGLLAAMDRKPADQPEERADERMTEERGVREDAQRPREGRHQDHRVHDRVVMIGGHDERPRGRHVFPPDDLDARVEEPEQQPGEAADERVPSRGRRSVRSPNGGRYSRER